MIYHILVKICGKFLGFTFFLLNQKHGFDYTDERNCVGWEKCLNVFLWNILFVTQHYSTVQIITIDTHWHTLMEYCKWIIGKYDHHLFFGYTFLFEFLHCCVYSHNGFCCCMTSVLDFFFLKNGPNSASFFVYFRPFLNTMSI